MEREKEMEKERERERDGGKPCTEKNKQCNLEVNKIILSTQFEFNIL